MISLLLINYRSAALAANAVRTARSATSAPLQVVIVDNSCDAAEAEALRGLADTLIVSKTNRGYAGGINDGRQACDGATIVVTNPDVTFAPQALDRLAETLDHRTAVAGPALFWDDAHEWRLPPADLTTTAEKFDEVLATRARAWFEQRDQRRIRKRIAFWSLQDTTEVHALSGAVMAIRARDFDDAGGFDERFRLYFEEIDFLRRIHERRKRIAYVPGARCRHLFNQSAARDADAARVLYAESELRYLEKWSGPFAARTLKKLERAPFAFDAASTVAPINVPAGTELIEVSPLASFATAAGHFPKSDHIDLPTEVRRSVGAAPLYVRLIDARQNVVRAFRLESTA